MRNPAPHAPRQIERRDDDEPAPPWPWSEPGSGQARRAEHQQHNALVEVSRGH